MRVNISKTITNPTNLFWIFLYFVLFLQLLAQTTFLQAFLFPLVLLVSLYPISVYLSRNLLRSALRKKKTYLFIFQFFIFSLIISVIFFLYVILFSKLEEYGALQGALYFTLDYSSNYFYGTFISVGILINLCICGLDFFLETLNLRNTLLKVQIQTLQQQITPHFMFNILNHINVLMQSNVELASSLLIKYSDILRYQLYVGNKEHVLLETDVQFLKDFISIEEIRWGNSLKVNSVWHIENGKIEIPVLLFIPFIENAFKHCSRYPIGSAYINIDFHQHQNLITLVVENNKTEKKTPKLEHSGLGLKNIKERLEILFPEKHVIKITEEKYVYKTQVTINLQ